MCNLTSAISFQLNRKHEGTYMQTNIGTSNGLFGNDAPDDGGGSGLHGYAGGGHGVGGDGNCVGEDGNGDFHGGNGGGEAFAGEEGGGDSADYGSDTAMKMIVGLAEILVVFVEDGGRNDMNGGANGEDVGRDSNGDFGGYDGRDGSESDRDDGKR
ncbi:hypothetical protein scyTo_0008481 [Scyliorhinus torazame]|uniref:Uncharacterized protein n=1 Tax=Scyliorhinus torazame TaxID=75743 RepID=A0A401PA05_SCYTO|nr:hypothetical protein [Scyliorhinus torazame]